ncbi:MAG: ATP-binding protein [Chloroflexi bacterium]|nr:ATP-binding protein [Chloroflexota bacterium]
MVKEPSREAGPAGPGAVPAVRPGATRRVVRERIDPRLTASLFANYRTPADAVLELVDNAVDSRVEGRPLEIDLALRPGTLVLTVVGGTGMGPTGLERDYLHWGASRKRGGDSIGRYGQGGKAAIGHLGTRFTIAAGRAGEAMAHEFADDTYRDRRRLRTYELVERTKPVDLALGYLRLEIGSIDRKIDARRLRARLEETYRPLLAGGDVTMRLDRAPIRPREWPVEERHPISVRAAGRLVRGWWGLLPDPIPGDAPEAGIRLYHLGRLIGNPEWFGHPGPAQHPALNRLIGEVELPHLPVTMNKSDVERGSAAWGNVETRLHQLLAPIVRRLTRQAETAPSQSALRTAEQVRRILARALRLLEAGKLFESELGVGGEGPGGQLTLDTPAHPPTADADADGEMGPGDEAPAEPSEPATAEPAPVRHAGTGPGRRSGIGEVVIRSLDPRLRSAMVVEDGVRRVVINSRYPLYEVRKGDLWYQLETALREVCVTIPEATVPEFERRVSELMLVSLSLAEHRRRRSRPAGPRPPTLL